MSGVKAVKTAVTGDFHAQFLTFHLVNGEFRNLHTRFKIIYLQRFLYGMPVAEMFAKMK